MLKSRLAFLFYMVMAVLLPSCPVIAQPTTSTAPQSSSIPQDVQMLKALLEEVRELRRTIERNNLRQLQAQILLKGIEKQQGHVANMSLELDQLRAHIQDLSNIGRHDETLKEAENAIREAVDPQSRALLTQAYEDLRKSLERQKKLDQQELENRRERDRQLEAQLRTEQAKLAELQEQLAALERELDKQANLGART